jgi:hypothetical protein
MGKETQDCQALFSIFMTFRALNVEARGNFLGFRKQGQARKLVMHSCAHVVLIVLVAALLHPAFKDFQHGVWVREHVTQC